jgi:hypothetical protein
LKTVKKAIGVLALLSPLAAGLVDAREAAAADDAPTIAKDSVQVTPFTLSAFHKKFDNWSWVPKIAFRVNGPIASGSQLYAEFAIPGGPPVKFDCPTSETQKGRALKTECGARDIPEDRATQYTGPVPFSIKMRNELSGAPELTLFAGHAKVEKARSNEHGPKATYEFVFFVDHDWNLPIGYVFLTPDDLKGWKYPELHVAFWVRGDTPHFDPHLFYNGAEVGKKFSGNDEVGKAGCGAEVEDNSTQYVEEAVPQKAMWSRINCRFPNVRGQDTTGDPPGIFGPPFVLAANPGDYEFKLLWDNHLARSIKFTVGADGKFDNGVAAANKLGSERTVVPVKILGDQDGPWDRTAWHAAFYGNPLTGFTALP